MKGSPFRCLLLIISVSARLSWAQTQDLAQLNAKVQQLEQMLQDLKQQIADAESVQKAPGKPFTTSTPPPSVPPPQVPTDHIGHLTATREVANDDAAGAARIDNEEIDPSLRGYFRLPGTGTLIRPGGFVKADLFVDANQAGTIYGQYSPSTFPSSPQPHTLDSTVSMRGSRLSTEFLQPVGDGPDTVKAYLEFDFLGNYDRNSLRMRQFYAQYRNLLAGQTWSAFGDPDAFPDTLDITGPPGMMGLRNPMIRYTQPLGKHNSIGVSVEKSGTDAPFSTQFGAPVSSSTRPDLIAFYRYENPHGHLYFAGISRSIGGVIPNENVPDLENHVNGYGGSLSGVWGSDTNNVVFQLMYGKGISTYYNDNSGLGADVGFDAHNELVATPSGSGTIGYQHYWAKLLRSTFSYGYLQINNTAADPGTSYHISHYATGNFIVQPSVSWMFGAEYIYGSAERKDDFKWIAPRVQASVTYYINKYPK